MDEFKATETGEDLQVSGLAGVRSRRLTSTEEPSSSPSTMELEAESMSVEWTDEKHSLYLKSMEASFVNELYDSMELLGWCSGNNHLSHSKSTKQTHPNPSASHAQFKVLRSGCWRKLNFERAESKAAKANEAHGELLSNPWILHFSSARNTQGGGGGGGGECHGAAERVASASQDNDSDRKKAMSRWGASSSKQFRFYRSNLRRQDSNGCKTEVSDQNFVDEDNEGEKKKRAKTQELDPYSASDQVVPLRKPQ